ncbi:MAG TPA: recombinase family protein [Oscillatoriaceae cyanobacterium]
MKRLVVYARVSTEGQAREGVSLDAQVAMAREYCQRHGYEYAGDYTDVASGRKDARPMLAQLLKDAKAHRFEMVAVYRLDRLGRSLVKTLQVVGDLSDTGVSLVSMTQPFEISGAMGKLLLAIYASFAEMESEAIGARIRDARRRLVVTKGRHYATPPFGYRREEKGGPLLVDEEKAEHVRWMFRQAAEGVGMPSICMGLNGQGVRTNTGGSWSVPAVRVVLMNPAYLGRITHGRKISQRTSQGEIKRRFVADYLLAEGEHEAIVDEKTWQAVQALFEARKGRPSRTIAGERKHPWLAVGRCGECGARLSVHTGGKGRKYPSYECHRHFQQAHIDRCGVGIISERILTGLVIRGAAKILAQDLGKAKGRAKPKQRAIEDRAKQIARIDAAIDVEKRLARSFAQSPEEAARNIAELTRQKEALAGPPPDQPPGPPPVIPDLVSTWRDLEPHQRAGLVRTLFSAVRITREAVVVEWTPDLAWHFGDSMTLPRPASPTGRESRALTIV